MWRLLVNPRIAATLGRGWSLLLWLRAAPPPPPFPQPTPSLQGLATLFFSLSGSREQCDMVVGSALSAATVSGAGMMLGPGAPEPLAAPSACSSASVPAPGVGSPTGGASVNSLTGQHEHTWESPCSERRCSRPSSGKRSWGSVSFPCPLFPSGSFVRIFGCRHTGGCDASSPLLGILARVWLTTQFLAVTALIAVVLRVRA